MKDSGEWDCQNSSFTFLGRAVTLFLPDSKFLYIEVVDFVKIG